MENDIDINELERLAKAATPGPWKLVGTVEQDGGTYRDIIPTSVSCGGWCQGGTPDRADECDLQYISAANPFSVLSLIDSLRKAKMRVQILERNLRDAEESGRRLAKQAHRAEQERDALAARLAELEGQEPVAWVEVVSPHEGPYNFNGITLLGKGIHHLYARPVPAEPVNARLLEALKRLSFCAQTTGGVAGRDDELCSAIEASTKAIAAAEAQQERLLQDMHDAGREVDRVMAEPQPDADGPWKSAVIDQLVIAHILTAEHESDPPLKAIQDLLAYHADIAVDPRVSGAAAKLVEQAKAEEREACAHKGWMAASWDCEDRVKAAILARGQK